MQCSVQCGNPPGRFEPTLKLFYFILQWEINVDAVIQNKAQRLRSVTEDRGSSQALSVNQTRLVQSNLWQATTSLWDTQSTSTPHNIISSSTPALRSTVVVRGEKYVSILQLQWQRRPYKCASVCLTTVHSFESLCALFCSCQFSLSTHTHTLEGFPGDCVPLLSVREGCTVEPHRQRPQWYHSNSPTASTDF